MKCLARRMWWMWLIWILLSTSRPFLWSKQRLYEISVTVAVSNLLEDLVSFSFIDFQSALSSYLGRLLLLWLTDGSKQSTLESIERESWAHQPPLFSSVISLSSPRRLRFMSSPAFPCLVQRSSKACARWIASGPRTALWMSCHGWRGPHSVLILKHFVYVSPLCWLWRDRKSGCYEYKCRPSICMEVET